MDYLNLYNKIINNAKNRKIDKNKYYEIHHIIPKSIGGTDDESNLVSLKLKEHYICHKLLCKIYPDNKSLAYAYWIMTITTIAAMENFKNNNLYGKDGYEIKRIKAFENDNIFIITSKEYEYCKEHWIKLCKGIKRNKEQCKRISIKTKEAMRRSDRIQKCKFNKGSHYYHEIETGIVHKWFPGDPDLDLKKYAWGRGKLSEKQKENISKTLKSLDKTCCKVGNTNYRYCLYKNFIKEIPVFFHDCKQKNNNSLRTIVPIIINSLSYLKEKNIFIDEYIVFNPLNNIKIITPSVYEVILDLLESESKELNYIDIANRIYEKIEEIKKLNKKYLISDIL